MVTRLHDLAYARIGERELVLDLYLPDGGAAHPVLVYLHGGGWAHGDKRDDIEARLIPLAERGIAAASVGYRKTGEAIYPAAVHDTKAAVRWLRANAEEHGIDSSRIALGGASAGGHLASLAALTNDEELEGTVGDHTDQSSAVGGVIAWYAPTDLVMSATRSPFEARVLNPPSAFTLLGIPADASAREHDVALRAASPRWRAHPDAPPHLLIHGDRDVVVPLEQSRVLHDALTGCGATSAMYVLGGAGHEDPKLETEGIAAIIAGFLGEHLQPTTSAT